MTYITQPTGRLATFCSRIATIILAGCALLVWQASAVQAQTTWTPSGNNIYNPNSGNVGVGTTNPGEKLVTVGNSLVGNITSHTQLYSTYDSQNNVIFELGYGTATSNITPLASLVLSKNLTSTNNAIGNIFFANSSIADGNDKRLSGIGSWTDGATNSGNLLFYTTNAGTLNERMRISPSGNIGFGTNNPLSNLQVGDQTAAASSSPVRLSLGATYSNTAGTNFKLRLFDDGNPANVYGLGVSAGSMDFGVISAAGYNWYSGGAHKMTLTGSGNVGIGTSSPGTSLDIAGNSMTIGSESGTAARGNNTIKLARVVMPAYSSASLPFALFGGATTSTANIASVGGEVLGMAAATQIDFVTAATTNVDTGTVRMTVNSAGNVGIGNTGPTEKLDVVGNLKVSGSGAGNITASGNMTVTGTITGGTITAKYQDVAEWVESSQALPAGTVVVLDHTRNNQVVASSKSYDTRVAGVISAQPGITLGEQSDSKVLVATTGRVKVKVDATAAPIEVGDLLVTSDVAGVAKKSEPLSLGGVQIHRPGTLIGKALEPLAKGTGEILVLLSLQ